MGTGELVILESTDLSTVAEERERLRESTKEYIKNSKAENTKKAYKSDWNQFQAFCSYFGSSSLPATPETIADYVTFMAQQGRRVATIKRHIASIAMAHKAAECEAPTQSVIVQETLKGVRNEHGAPQVQVAPLLIEDLRQIMNHLPNNTRGTRDRAILLIGFAGAFRRSELAAMKLEHIDEKRDGLEITLPRSKTDQEGNGRKVFIPYGSHPDTCPVRAFKDWIVAARIESGFLFLPINKGDIVMQPKKPKDGEAEYGINDKTIARLVKKYAKKVGLKPERFAGHSLRAGLATSAAAAGVSRHLIQKQTGHKSNVVDRYIRPGEGFRENAAAKVGL